MREALRLIEPDEIPNVQVAEPIDCDAANRDLAGASAETIVSWASRHFGHGLVLSSSFGAESAVMLHLVSRLVPQIRVVFVDTGYLFPETYRFAEELQKRFKLDLRVYAPAMTAARQEALYGPLWSGDEEKLRLYQRINKVEPMDRALSDLGARAWLAGLRGQQTAFRSSLRPIEYQDGIYKIHPILNFSKQDVQRYMAEHDLPYHPLHARGYRSIGDVHSTRPTTDDQDARAGRALGAHSECGLHLPRSPAEDSSLKASSL